MLGNLKKYHLPLFTGFVMEVVDEDDLRVGGFACCLDGKCSFWRSKYFASAKFWIFKFGAYPVSAVQEMLESKC